MTTQNQKNNYKDKNSATIFSKKIWLLPFGKISKDRNHNKSVGDFVGKDGERAFLVNALTDGGSRGSYLVTGRRGVGKTSFVESCIQEYEESVFKRFLRSSHGRSLFDRIAMVSILFLILVSLLVASDILQPLAVNVHENALLVLAIVPLGIFVAIPLFYSFFVFRTAFKLLIGLGLFAN